MFTAGRGGKTTGMGAHLFVIDDPIKNSAEADSEVIREQTWNWYQSVASTRMETPPEWAPGANRGAQLVIHTRWHEDDLIGRLMETQPGEWTVINLPALAEEGDDPLGREPGAALWPERFPVETLEQTRAELISGDGIRFWWALYQQRPTSESGDEFDMGKLRYFGVVETGEGPALSLDGKLWPLRRLLRFGTMDLAISLKTRADWTVLSSWGATRQFPADLCLLDVLRDRVDSGGHMTMLERGLAKHQLQFVGIENKTFGTNLLEEAARRRLPIRPVAADTDKVTRAQPAASLLQAGRLWLPKDPLPWRDIAEAEMTAFPNGRHDDIVDTLSNAAIIVEERRLGKKPKDEPQSVEEKTQRWIADRIGKKKKRRIHPTLGRI
jgi:predicted phage terminase large subunit-like protein